MVRKRSFFRMLIRILLAGGIVLFTTGLIFSVTSSAVVAAGKPGSPAGPGWSVAKINVQSSSLVFLGGCTCSCQSASVQVCNLGQKDMQASAAWSLFYSASGSPEQGQEVASGALQPLRSGSCVMLDQTPPQPGYYAYRVQQEPGAAGPETIWSNSCQVAASCFPAATATASGTLTPAPVLETVTLTPPAGVETATATLTPPAVAETATVTLTPPLFIETATLTLTPPLVLETITATATASAAPSITPSSTPRPPLDFNLSFVCGYPGEDELLWKVANNTSEDAGYVWRVVDSDEEGAGTVAANGTDYFTTSTSAQRVRLFVESELMDTAVASGPCKSMLELSYTCTAGGQDWYARNPNNFAVNFDWELASGANGSGSAGPNATVFLTSSGAEPQEMVLTWTDTRPGVHEVSLTSMGCPGGDPATPSPTVTETLPPTLTFTPTMTLTPPLVVITETVPPTLTSTPTNTLPPPTLTSTPTVTLPPPTLTSTPTNTLPPPTLTSTPTNTLPAPLFVLTDTATPTATLVQFSTPTFTPTATLVSAAPTFTLTPTTALTGLPQFLFTPTRTSTATLIQPGLTVTRTPILIPVTGANLSELRMQTWQYSLGRFLVNAGLFLVGIALALAAVSNQVKR